MEPDAFFELALPTAETWVVIALGVAWGIALIHLLLQAVDSVVGRFLEREVGAVGKGIARLLSRGP